MSIEHFIITVYCLIDDELKKLIARNELRTIGRKVLAHTVGMMVNKMLGNPPLQFERLNIV